VTLYAISDISKQERGGFKRVFRHDILYNEKVIDCKFNSYYIAGASNHNIYFGNITAPLHVLKINTLSNDTQYVKIKIDSTITKLRTNTILKVDSSNFYLMDGVSPLILRGKIDDWKAAGFMSKTPYFSHAIPINHSSLAIRSISSKNQEYVLGKVNSHASSLSLKPDLLQKQVDGVFCVDGTLFLNKDFNLLLYVYFYRNQYIVMDTSLNLLFRANTIDTNTHSKIKSDSIKSENSLAKSRQSKLVNYTSAASFQWLFINSQILSENETIQSFKENSVIDIYNLIDKKYKFSMYIPNYSGIKMETFQIYKNKMAVLYDHYIVLYDLSLPATPYDKYKNIADQ
jgi:hypothetical protein